MPPASTLSFMKTQGEYLNVVPSRQLSRPKYIAVSCQSVLTMFYGWKTLRNKLSRNCISSFIKPIYRKLYTRNKYLKEIMALGEIFTEDSGYGGPG